MLALTRKVTLRAYIINLLKVVSYISGGTSDGLYLYSGDLNEVTVSICHICERSRLIGSCQIGCLWHRCAGPGQNVEAAVRYAALRSEASAVQDRIRVRSE